MRVTLADIAKAAGVNKTTVSKAMRGGNDINAGTRRKILELAEQLGYEPPTGRKRSESRRVGVLCPEVSSHYYARIAEALDAKLAAAGFAMLLCQTGFDRERERAALASFRDVSADAIICITETPNLDLMISEVFPERSVPVVILGIDYEGVAHDVISVDERLGIRRVAEQLARLKHRRIAFLGDRFVNGRREHLRQALAELNIPLPDEYAVTVASRNEACGYEGMRALLALNKRPTAVVAGYDAIALGAYRALAEAGVSVPAEVSLVGFDNAPFCPYLPVSLTTIDSNVEGMCGVAVAIAANKIRRSGPRIIQRVAIQPEFILRESLAEAMAERA